MSSVSELCAGYVVEEYDDLDTEEVVIDSHPHRWTRETLRRQQQYLTHAVLTTEQPLTNDERAALWREKRDILREELWLSMGYDVADDINGPELETLDNSERISENMGLEMADDDTAAGVDPGARKVYLYECYVRHDADEDGLAGWLRVMRVGDEILSVEEVDEPPLLWRRRTVAGSLIRPQAE